MSEADSTAPPESVKAAKGQPVGIWVLFLTEMWERFSYYGMRALLVLYLVSKTSGENPGFGWSEESASQLYGWYTGLVYLTPIAGGWLADKLLGTHRSMLLGGWVIAAGHFCLALTEFAGATQTEAITLQSAPGPFLCFMTGLALIILGTGLFKPCATVMVGQLYSDDDPRRDSGFTIFYMGINVGAFLSGFVAGTLGEKVGWHWGFGSAGVGMVLGLIGYQLLRPFFLQGIGLPPGQERAKQKDNHDVTAPAPPLSRVEIDRMTVIMILGIFAIAFWVAFEQAGSSLNLFAKEKTDRSIAGYAFGFEDGQFPATWFQSVNPAAIILFAPFFAWLWIWLDRRDRQPSTPVKFALGLLLLSVGYIPMILAAKRADVAERVGPGWLILTFTMHTWGELCLSPVGLSMVTRLSPARYTSMMMGLYFGTYFVSNLVAGYLAGAAGRIERGELFTLLGGQADFFLIMFLIPFAVGCLVLALAPWLKRLMHGLS